MRADIRSSGFKLPLMAAVLASTIFMGGCESEVPSRPIEKSQVMEAEPEVIKPVQTYSYTPIGKRDPFRPFFLDAQRIKTSENPSPLEQFEIEQLKLVGLITGLDKPVALVEDPSGKGYIIEIGTAIGRNGGKVSSITKDEVMIEEEYFSSEGKRIINKIPMKIILDRDDV